MSNYKEASRIGLRINTIKGSLSVEQLWSLTLPQLDELAVSLEDNVEKSVTKTYLKKRTNKNKLAQLSFDIVLDILQTKMAEAEELQSANEIKKHNDKILTLIAEKQEEDLRGKSAEELQALLK
jgi:hypothetical protein